MLDVPLDRLASNIQHVGNTSAASVLVPKHHELTGCSHHPSEVKDRASRTAWSAKARRESFVQGTAPGGHVAPGEQTTAFLKVPPGHPAGLREIFDGSAWRRTYSLTTVDCLSWTVGDECGMRWSLPS